MRVLVIGGSPEPSSPSLVKTLGYSCDVVVAIDRGFDYAVKAGIEPDLFCGDADTISERGRLLLQQSGTEKIFYNPHKDDTDLGLALAAIAGRWPDSDLICTCLSGGSPDHFLGVMGRLASFDRGRVGVREDSFVARILKAGESWPLCAPEGTRFSFIPLSSDLELSLRGMEWNLDRQPVPLLSDLGISNLVRGDDAEVQVHQGTLVAYLFTE